MHSKDLLSEEIHGSERRGIFDLKDYKGLKIPGDLPDHPQILLLWTECLHIQTSYVAVPLPKVAH